MSRRKRGFSFLRKALKYSNGAPPAGAIANFDAFLKGTRTRNAGTIPPDARIRLSAAILPFGIPETEIASSDREIVSVTKHSNDAKTTFSLSNLNLGWANPANDTRSSPNYYSAQMIITAGGTVGADRTSGITALTYKNYNRSSYTIPFGRHAADVTRKGERDCFLANAADARASAGAVKSVRHVPEQYNAGAPTFDAAP